MKGRTPTAKEKEWMDSIREVGCIACIRMGFIKPYSVPTEYTAIHHIEGKTKPDAHFLTIPLCPNHHQHGIDAVHINKRSFEKKFGNQYNLVREVRKMLNCQNSEGRQR